MNDWQPEIEAASHWWVDRMMEALDKAYPADSVWARAGDRLRQPSNLECFREALCVMTDLYFRKIKAPWDRSLPMDGSGVRKVGLDGAFLSPALEEAVVHANLEETIPFLPDGCITIICPGTVYAAPSRRVRQEVIVVDPSPLPVHMEGYLGHGI